MKTQAINMNATALSGELGGELMSVPAKQRRQCCDSLLAGSQSRVAVMNA
ncbi:hypothetical protein N9K16_04895 [Alphaproteobacteria bacterium]|nr:hypothetical protein [Alphaproteobacteria bacterium]